MSKTAPKHHRPARQLGQRFYGLMIIFAASAILIIFAIFFHQKVTDREKLAAALPADRTVAFLEYNLAKNYPETAEIMQLVAKNAFAQGISAYLSGIIPNPDLFHQWYAGRGGVAALADPTGRQVKLVFFLQVNNHDLALAWVNQLILDPQNEALLAEDYHGQKILSFRSGQTYNLLLSHDYLVISDDLNNLKNIAEVVSGKLASLRGQPSYNQLISALPDQNQFFFYLNRARMLETLSKNQLFLAGHLASYKLYFPFLKLFSQEAVAVKFGHDQEQKPRLIAEHLALFDQQALPAPDLFSTDYFYSDELEKLLPPAVIFSAGGVNLLDQKNKLQAYFKDRSTVYDLLFSGMLNSFKDSLQGSGSKLDLDQDFFPLFQKEYLFFASQPPSNSKLPDLTLILQSNSPENDARALSKVILAVGPKLAAQIDAKPTPFTLPDGTVGSEMKADLGQPVQSNVTIAGHSAGQQIQFSPHLSIYLYPDIENQHLLVSTSALSLEQILAPHSQASTINYNLSKPTEAYHLDVHQLASFWPTAAVLKPVQSIIIARKFIETGLLSTYQLGF